MENPDIVDIATRWSEILLIWVGFGTLTGLAAKALMPGRDPGGAVVTVLMGIGGTVIGCGSLAFFYEGARISPISPLGFLVATGGAFILLFFYRVLGGYWFVEGDQGLMHGESGKVRRRRSRSRYFRSYAD